MTKFNSSFEAGMLTPVECPRCRELAELVRLLTERCAEYRKAQEWMPIVTAPKDRPILVWWKNREIPDIARWSPIRNEFLMWNGDWPAGMATHWAELPPPPKGEEEEKRFKEFSIRALTI